MKTAQGEPRWVCGHFKELTANPTLVSQSQHHYRSPVSLPQRKHHSPQPWAGNNPPPPRCRMEPSFRAKQRR